MKSLFTEPVSETAAPRSDALHIAAAALLVRAAQIDGVMDDNETKLLTRLVGPHFGLESDAAALLIEEAKHAANEASDLFQFTHRINTHFGETHKIMLIELLWQLCWPMAWLMITRPICCAAWPVLFMSPTCKPDRPVKKPKRH